MRPTPNWLLINLERKLEWEYGGFMSVVGTKRTLMQKLSVSAFGGKQTSLVSALVPLKTHSGHSGY